MNTGMVSPADLRRNWQSFAAMDAVLMPDWQYRYYSFDARWDFAERHELGSLRDGEGQEAFVRFSPYGVVGKVRSGGIGTNDMRSDLAQRLPKEQRSFIGEPAFQCDIASSFFWIQYGEKNWNFLPSKIDDIEILRDLQMGISGYIAWAKAYHEKDVDAELVKKFLSKSPVSFRLAFAINDEIKEEQFDADMLGIFGQI